MEYTKDPMKMLNAFWKTGEMYCESCCFMMTENGAQGRLLFLPEEIISVYDSTQQIEYKRGIDWDWDAQYCRLIRPEGSRIGYFTREEVTGVGIKDYSAEPVGFDENGLCRIGNAVYCENKWIWGRVFYVTYKGKTDDYPVRNSFKPELLPKIMKMLTEGKPFRMVFFGDSTHTGCDSSSWYKREPFMPGYPELVVNYLRKHYGSDITYVNHSVGGKDSVWGKEVYQQCVIDENPDLLLLGFGNNDNKYGEGLLKTVNNIKEMMSRALDANPDCEIIILSPSINNPDSGWTIPTYKLIEPYKAMERVGVRYCNFFEMGLDLVNRKDFYAITGNGIAHPNDWTTRIHALNLLALLVDFDKQ